MNNKPWFSTSTEAIRWMRDEARQWVDDKPEVAAHLFEAAMMFEKAGLDARRYQWFRENGSRVTHLYVEGSLLRLKPAPMIDAAIDAALKEPKS